MLPVRDPQKIAVIWRLSLTPITSTHLDPTLSMVHPDAGTKWISV